MDNEQAHPVHHVNATYSLFVRDQCRSAEEEEEIADENQQPADYNVNRQEASSVTGNSLATSGKASGGQRGLSPSFTGIENIKKLRHVSESKREEEFIGAPPVIREESDNQHLFVNPVTLRKLPQIIAPQFVQQAAGGGNTMPDDGSGSKTVWRVERFQLKPVEELAYGIFYSGDSYVIQYSSRTKGVYLYYWLGTHSSADERGTAALKTIELDDQLGGLATHVRIVQGKEPPHFLALFDGFIVVLDGGYPSGFQPVHFDESKSNKEAAEAANSNTLDIHDNHLLHIRAAAVHPGNNSASVKDMKFGRAIEVEFRARSLNSNDVFVATTKARLACVWYGKGSSRVERALAHEACKRLAPGGAHAHAQWTVNDPITEDEEPAWFWEALGGQEPYANDKRLQQPPSEEAESDIPHAPARLFHCSNASGQFAVEEIEGEFDQSSLIAEDVMLLDTYDALWIWIGARANREERYHTEQFAKEYLKHEQAARCAQEKDADGGICVKMPVYCIKQGAEPVSFCGFFGAWDEKLAKREMENGWWSARKPQPSNVAVYNESEVNGQTKQHGDETLEVPAPEMRRSLSTTSFPGSPMQPVGPMPTRESLDEKYVSHEKLKNKLPEELPFNVDPRCKEIYLNDEEFAKAFDGNSYEAFQALPKWRQLNMKKAAGLF